MKFKVKVFDKEGQELEIANKVIEDLVFESEQAIECFINSIKGSLPIGFKYNVIPIGLMTGFLL
ncbi:hypothetical protein ABES38_08755 [Bacillus gobiensis]|uniref:hypothetical protein n=1 Tax=Bacillus gobiensis TaxID=1441095 RepID=UPI003D213015